MLLKKVRNTGTVDKFWRTDRRRSAHTFEIQELVNDLMLTEDDAPRTHRTILVLSDILHLSATVCVEIVLR